MTTMTMTRGTMYDPWSHAESFGLKVTERTLAESPGLWVPEAQTIVLERSIEPGCARQVLAHMVGHAQHEHLDERPDHELTADRFAVWHLIDPDELADAVAISHDLGAWGRSLGVAQYLVRLYMLDFHLERPPRRDPRVSRHAPRERQHSLSALFRRRVLRPGVTA